MASQINEIHGDSFNIFTYQPSTQEIDRTTNNVVEDVVEKVVSIVSLHKACTKLRVLCALYVYTGFGGRE